MDMRIGSAVSAASQANPATVQGQVSISVLKMSLDQVEETGAFMIKMMEQSVNPGLGQNIDVRI